MQNLKTIRKRNPKAAKRLKRKISVRKKISGESGTPRLSVFRSAKHIYVQAIDDDTGATIASASTVEKDLSSTVKGMKKKEAAAKVGEAIAKRLLEKGVSSAVFDRNGFRYHGRVAAIADGAREAGLTV
ncbi:MAG: 50S ribosomal protein L18 [Deltaproteobacteria bacterium]|nr:50S ribosomal protein L18 [Deltaproteobacteria bacterium]